MKVPVWHHEKGINNSYLKTVNRSSFLKDYEQSMTFV